MFFCLQRLVLVSLLFMIPLAQATEKEHILSAKEANQLSNNGQLLLVDIRSVEEWQQTGVAPQALLLSIHEKGGIPQFSQRLLKAVSGNKNKSIALICAGGVRSARVRRYLMQQGFRNITDVAEGMVGGWFTQGWIEQGLPIKTYKNDKVKAYF